MILGVKPFALYIDYYGFKALFLGFHKFASFDRPGTIYSVINNCLTQPSSLRGTSSTDHDLPRDDRLCLYITDSLLLGIRWLILSKPDGLQEKWKPGTE